MRSLPADRRWLKREKSFPLKKQLKLRTICATIAKAMSRELQEGIVLEILKTILTVIFILVSLALTVIILMQEGKSAGLGAIAGAADTYWGRNKGRSMEGMLVKGTRILVILFLLLAVVLNIGIF